ncbi:mucin-2 [Halyomorpha halys]|uniref:mucin-2 n=1 Tax=Halyomorpha halys TaxID=286706 RepID=UPI0006D50DE4|nr:mucin-5AC-like [Halyomorpha halys]
MEYSPMLVVMLWALTPSDASSIAAKVQEMPTPGMTVHQESYFTFNHGKPFLAEQDPLTGAILNLKTTPVIQDDYVYEEEEETDGIDRKDSPKIFTRNDIAQPSKDADLHKFLNLPVHYSSSGKFPLISSSYANTKVQGHGASAYSNHRLNPTTSTSTVSPSYYSLKTSTSTTNTEGTTSTTTRTTTTTTTTTSPTTTTTTTTTLRPPTTRTTSKPPSSYEYEYEYDYDNEHEKESTENKTSNHNILDFFDKDYELLGASEEEKNTSKVGTNQPTGKPQDVVMVAPNTNIFIPADYLKPSSDEKYNKTEYQQTTTVKTTTSTVAPPTTSTTMKSTTFPTIRSTTESFIVTSSTQNRLLYSYTERPKPSNEIEKTVPTTESSEVNDKVDHSIFGMKITNKDKQEVTTKKEDDPSPTLQTTEKRPIVFLPTRLPDEINKNETKLITAEEEDRPIRKRPNPQQSDESKPSEVIVPPTRPSDFHYTFVKPGTRPLNINPQQNGHFNPYQRPYTAPTMVPTEMLPPQRPLEHYHRPQERPYPEILQYRPIEQNRPQSNKPMVNVGNRVPIYNIPENKPVLEQTNNRPVQTFLPTPMRPVESKPHEIIPQKLEPKPFATMAPTTSSRPGESSSVLINRPHILPQRQEFQPRPTDAATPTRNPENVQKPSKVSNQPTDIMYPPYSQIRPQEPEQKPYVPEYRPQNPRPEQTRPPIVIPDLIHSLETQSTIENQNQQTISFSNNKPYPSQFNQPSKVESHFIKVSPGQENPSYSLQTSFSIGVPPAEEPQQGISNSNPTKVAVAPVGQGVGQVLFPDEEEKRPWTFQEEKRPQPQSFHSPEGEKYPRPSWESHLKPPLAFNHLRKEPFLHKRPKPRPDLPNILPQFRPNAKVGHAEPHIYFKTPLDTLQPPPLPRPQFLRAESEEEKQQVHRRNGQSTRVAPVPAQPAHVPVQPAHIPVQPAPVPKRGALRSEDEKTDPVFVVYPSNNAQDGVVIGTRGPQRPLPPDNLELEDSFPLDTNKNFQARVDTPILKGKVTSKPIVKNDFPYPLVKPTEIEEKVITTVTKEYTAFSPTVSPTEKEHDTEINVIPYLQDYQPFATKKPAQEPPVWNTGNDTKPISVTLKTQKTEVTTSKIDNHKTSDSPTPQDFQAPFYASLSAPNQGWSVLRPRPSPEKEEEETTTAKIVEEQESKFDIQNFKPQLFGGFKPIIPPNMEPKEPIQEDKENL